MNYKLQTTPCLACPGSLSLPGWQEPSQHPLAAGGTVKRHAWNMKYLQTEQVPCVIWIKRSPNGIRNAKLRSLWRVSIYVALCTHKMNFNHLLSKLIISQYHKYLYYGWYPKLDLLPVKKGTFSCTWRLFLMLLWSKIRNFWNKSLNLDPDPSLPCTPLIPLYRTSVLTLLLAGSSERWILSVSPC